MDYILKKFKNKEKRPVQNKNIKANWLHIILFKKLSSHIKTINFFVQYLFVLGKYIKPNK